MKLNPALLSLSLLSTLLTACGNAQLPQLARMPQRMAFQAQTAPQAATQAATQAAPQTQYFLGHALQTHFSRDQNGMQFGFDMGHVTYRDLNNQLLGFGMRYQVQSKRLSVSLTYWKTDAQGQDQVERVEQIAANDSQRLQELALVLRQLSTASAEDKANIQQILTYL